MIDPFLLACLAVVGALALGYRAGILVGRLQDRPWSCYPHSLPLDEQEGYGLEYYQLENGDRVCKRCGKYRSP